MRCDRCALCSSGIWRTGSACASDATAMNSCASLTFEATDESGRTAVMLAAKEGQTVATELLLGKGADVEARDEDGWTVLMLAAQEGQTAVDGHQRLALGLGQDVGEDVSRHREVKMPAATSRAATVAIIGVRVFPQRPPIVRRRHGHEDGGHNPLASAARMFAPAQVPKVHRPGHTSTPHRRRRHANGHNCPRCPVCVDGQAGDLG